MERLIAFGTAPLWTLVILGAAAVILAGLLFVACVIVRRSQARERFQLRWLFGASSRWTLGGWPDDPTPGTRVFLMAGGPLAVLTPDGPIVAENGALIRAGPNTRPLSPGRGAWLIVGSTATRAVPLVSRSPSRP